MNRVAQPLPSTTIDPRYPDSFRNSMGDTDFHTLATIFLREGLEDHFVDDDVYVASSIVFYYKQDETTKRKDPDILVAKKVGKHLRRSYRLWEEKVVPAVVWEITSKRTWRNDINQKRLVCARLNVKEYFLFDPEARYLSPRLQGFRAVKGKSVPIKPNPDGSLTSRELGLRLIAEGLMVRLIDLKTDESIPTRAERAIQAELFAAQEAERAAQEAERAAQQAKRAAQAEQRNAELMGELERLRNELAAKK